MKKILLVPLIISSAILSFVVSAYAAKNQPNPDPEQPYPLGASGIAISYPQCSKPLPTTTIDFAILGVTGGRSLTENPCLKTQIEWASQNKYATGFYLNLTYPTPLPQKIASTFDCKNGDEKCLAYQFGYRTAKEAHAYAVSQGAHSAPWWLDVQIISSWSTDKTINGQTALGAISYFKEQGLPVGLSTTPYQWRHVMGDLTTGLPTWIPGRAGKSGAARYCTKGRGYSGGAVRQLAYVENDLEMVYACGK